jgi:hypothetical protein
MNVDSINSIRSDIHNLQTEVQNTVSNARQDPSLTTTNEATSSCFEHLIKGTIQ